MMKSKRRGVSTLECSVTNVSPFGLWILVHGNEYFLSHKQFPFFQDSTVSEVLEVVSPRKGHLRWPQLDIDLHIDSLQHPERYPLIAKKRDKRRPELTSTRRSA